MNVLLPPKENILVISVITLRFYLLGRRPGGQSNQETPHRASPGSERISVEPG